MNTLLLAIIPLLPGNWDAVRQRSNTEPVDVLFVMDNCIPCVQVKNIVPDTTYEVHNTNPMFMTITKGKVRRFPTLGVLYKGEAKFYTGEFKIRQLFKSRNPQR